MLGLLVGLGTLGVGSYYGVKYVQAKKRQAIADAGGKKLEAAFKANNFKGFYGYTNPKQPVKATFDVLTQEGGKVGIASRLGLGGGQQLIIQSTSASAASGLGAAPEKPGVLPQVKAKSNDPNDMPITGYATMSKLARWIASKAIIATTRPLDQNELQVIRNAKQLVYWGSTAHRDLFISDVAARLAKCGGCKTEGMKVHNPPFNGDSPGNRATFPTLTQQRWIQELQRYSVLEFAYPLACLEAVNIIASGSKRSGDLFTFMIQATEASIEKGIKSALSGKSDPTSSAGEAIAEFIKSIFNIIGKLGNKHGDGVKMQQKILAGCRTVASEMGVKNMWLDLEARFRASGGGDILCKPTQGFMPYEPEIGCFAESAGYQWIGQVHQGVIVWPPIYGLMGSTTTSYGFTLDPGDDFEPAMVRNLVGFPQ